MKSKDVTIEKTVALDLCVSCGICKAACPEKSIEMYFSKGQFYPRIIGRCNLCGVCLAVCPGIDFMVDKILVQEGQEAHLDIFIGPVLKSYICYTKNEQIRRISTSGGMITSIIVDLITKGYYQGAFVLPVEEINVRPVKVVYTRSINDIIAAAKSKYLPASVENVINYFKNKIKPSIIVGTPCQILGIKKYLQFYNQDYSDILFLGLFCDKTLSYNLISFYEWKYGRGRKIKNFNYRDKEYKGWPGDTTLIFNSGYKQFIDRKVRMRLKKYFQLKRCLFCIDKLNQLADISFGDCYIEGEESQLGQSNIIVRTAKGKEALAKTEENYVLKEVSTSIIAHSQNISLKQKNLVFSNIFSHEKNYHLFPIISNEYSDISIAQIKEYKKMCKNISYGKQSKFLLIDLICRIGQIKHFIYSVICKSGVVK